MKNIKVSISDEYKIKAIYQKVFELESAGGLLLMGSAVLAIVVANSPYEHWYTLFLSTAVEIRIGALEIAKPLLLWINDGLFLQPPILPLL
jgi:Na+/H+ antiporter NhaA